MTATYDLTSDIGKIRLLISDTDVTPASDAHFTDEELQVLLDLGGSVYMAAALALESWAGSLSESTDSEKIGDYSYTKKQVTHKLDLAKRYREANASALAFDIASMKLTAGSAITAEED